MRYTALLLSLLLLAACDVTTPSQVKTGKIRVTEDAKTVMLSPAKINPAQIDAIADDYKANGRGGMTLLMPYVSGNPLREVETKRQGEMYKQAFGKSGVKSLQIEYVPVADAARADHAVLTYSAVTALPPADCSRLTGYMGAESIKGVQDYTFGCETRTAISKMVARPEDLMGRDGGADGESRRQGPVVEKYKTGVPNEKLEALTASTVGTGQ